MSNGQIVVSDLTKRYKNVTAVDHLSFVVEPGRVTGFLGPNGAGKTTTLRMILNLVTPSSGSATISGLRYSDSPEPLRLAGAILEASAAHKGRTARNHLRIVAAAAGIPDAQVDKMLELVGLTPAAKRKFRGYSLGMKQRLGIAQAMLGDPQVLILDEPANGLDPEGIRWMRGLLQGLAQQGRTVLVSSHLLSEMEILADDVVIIAAGRLVTQGPVEQIVGSGTSGPRTRVRTPNLAELVEAVRTAGATIQPNGNDSHVITGLDAPAVGRLALQGGIELHELVNERPDLEHVFLELTQGKAAIR
ncbi:ABC transporter ATP-binding protein [Dactylosporangium sp. NPDC049525]|uniref:ABC transporter ATP-binding protein n=1 Tax=Dactylosporangium sp. NPDC049525 TaxID=3154730 RepID=UPI00341F100C